MGFSTPIFWLGIILQILFGLKLGLLPVSGLQSAGQAGLADLMLHLILPAVDLWPRGNRHHCPHDPLKYARGHPARLYPHGPSQRVG